MCAPPVLESLCEKLGRREFLKWSGISAAAATVAAAASPARAQVTPRPGFSNVMDLSHVHATGFPIWPGFTPIQVATLVTHDKDGFFANLWVTPEHHATHVDAPIHFGKNAWSAEAVPATTLVSPAVVIHIHDRARGNPDAQVTVDDLKAWEGKHGRIPNGAAVLMYSGWEARAGDQTAFRNMDAQGGMHFPGFSKEAGEFLLKERNINGIGVDTLSLDHGASKDFAVHYSVLPANKWGIENLANLAKIPEAGATIFVGLPKVKGASGGPARILAVW
jgi:kynurenine formamidase